VYLVTVCVADRQAVLDNEALARAIAGALGRSAAVCGWHVGRYVVMPDHVHLFCAPGANARTLSALVSSFKRGTTRAAWAAGWRGRLWQREFFDHLLRSDESYGAKWAYVRLNPVRAGLCQDPTEWLYQGELEVL
jgi:REP element-mobilizing transposase RayT